MPHLIFILFLFALGACVGSFLNVVVWRLPRDESLVSPGSHCPKCNTPLAWYDNIPIFGWIALRGKCRYCREKISPRYPIVEAVTALLFVFYYVMFFILQIGPCAEPDRRSLFFPIDWPVYLLDMFLISGLLAASLIDAELFIIPIEIPWLAAIVGIIAHGFIPAHVAGSLGVNWLGAATAVGGASGLILSIILFQLGFIPRSFPKGEPLLEIDREQIALEIEEAKRTGRTPEFEGELPPPYTPTQVRFEISKEMLFLLPPMIGVIVAIVIASSRQSAVDAMLAHQWMNGVLGAVLGALIGAFVVWITRILGTLGFGRIAMGLGDVHLMFGVGAVLGAGAATLAFFIAPFFGMVVALPNLAARILRRMRSLLRRILPRNVYGCVLAFIRYYAFHELPYGPYLALGTAVVILFYCRFADYARPGLYGMMEIIQSRLGY